MTGTLKTDPILAFPREAAMPIGDKIQALRTTKGWSQEELAKKLKTTGPNISRWENNNGYPSAEALRELGKAFDVSVDYFLYDEAPIRPLVGFKDQELLDLFAEIDQLDQPARNALKRIIKALTNEKKMRELLDKAS